jgi:hypothetical protein
LLTITLREIERVVRGWCDFLQSLCLWPLVCPSRHFPATRHFGCNQSEADIEPNRFTGSIPITPWTLWRLLGDLSPPTPRRLSPTGLDSDAPLPRETLEPL